MNKTGISMMTILLGVKRCEKGLSQVDAKKYQPFKNIGCK